MITKRKEFAKIAQGGASNAYRLSTALTEAMQECRDEGVDYHEDPAVFLILHQLVWVLTTHDFSLDSERMAKRWGAAYKLIEDDAA